MENNFGDWLNAPSEVPTLVILDDTIEEDRQMCAEITLFKNYNYNVYLAANGKAMICGYTKVPRGYVQLDVVRQFILTKMFHQCLNYDYDGLLKEMYNMVKMIEWVMVETGYRHTKLYSLGHQLLSFIEEVFIKRHLISPEKFDKIYCELIAESEIGLPNTSISFDKQLIGICGGLEYLLMHMHYKKTGSSYTEDQQKLMIFGMFVDPYNPIRVVIPGEYIFDKLFPFLYNNTNTAECDNTNNARNDDDSSNEEYDSAISDTNSEDDSSVYYDYSECESVSSLNDNEPIAADKNIVEIGKNDVIICDTKEELTLSKLIDNIIDCFVTRTIKNDISLEIDQMKRDVNMTIELQTEDDSILSKRISNVIDLFVTDSIENNTPLDNEQMKQVINLMIKQQ